MKNNIDYVMQLMYLSIVILIIFIIYKKPPKI